MFPGRVLLQHLCECQGCSQRNVRKSDRSVNSSLWVRAICLVNGILKLLETPDITHLCFFTQYLQTEARSDRALSHLFTLPAVALAVLVGSRYTFSIERNGCTEGLQVQCCPCPGGTAGLWQWFYNTKWQGKGEWVIGCQHLCFFTVNCSPKLKMLWPVLQQDLVSLWQMAKLFSWLLELLELSAVTLTCAICDTGKVLLRAQREEGSSSPDSTSPFMTWRKGKVTRV